MADSPKKLTADQVRIPASTHLFGWMAEAARPLWIALGNMESSILRDRLDAVATDRPVYICGLARSGSTILLETLAKLPGVATHRYRDFPFLFTPIAWNRFLDRVPGHADRPVERTHLDGIYVTPDSPEAMEEPLWMAFFPGLHDPGRCNVLDRGTENARFERFYRDHVAKILALRGGGRYVAKGNYNLTRLAYLHRLFPDARFIVPVRHPVWHVASLLKQHRLFLEAERLNPRVRAYMRRVGHLEFGGNRTPVNPGDAAGTESVARLWAEGEDVRGTARYWSLLYRFVHGQLEADGALGEAARVVRYEDLCGDPRGTLGDLLKHAGLEAGDPSTGSGLDAAAAGIQAPGYYRPRFTREELTVIREETEETAALYGYGPETFEEEPTST